VCIRGVSEDFQTLFGFAQDIDIDPTVVQKGPSTLYPLPSTLYPPPSTRNPKPGTRKTNRCQEPVRTPRQGRVLSNESDTGSCPSRGVFRKITPVLVCCKHGHVPPIVSYTKSRPSQCVLHQVTSVPMCLSRSRPSWSGPSTPASSRPNSTPESLNPKPPTPNPNP